MSKPVIADNKPATVTLTKGKEYAFCRCGRSASQPFCDGSLAGTGFTPQTFVAERAGTGICSGEGGMLPEEQQENARYFDELASARFGYREDLLEKVQAFHFKGGQGAGLRP